jgi:ribonucleoside-diphosphate reductase alpha chain
MIKKLKRSKITSGQTERIETGCGHLYVTVNRDNRGKPIEVFASLGKCGGCAGSMCQAVGRVVSLCLKYHAPVEEIVEQLEGINCPNPTYNDGEKILSCADAMSKGIRRGFLPDVAPLVQK